jgi:hypothetical protein
MEASHASSEAVIANSAGELTLDEKIEVWRQRHEAAAADFHEFLLRIRAEGAQRFTEGVWSLWQAAEAMEPVAEFDSLGVKVDPATSSLHSGFHLALDLKPVQPSAKHRTVEKSPYIAISERWLLSFEAMARLLKDEYSEILAGRGPSGKFQAQAFRTLVEALGKPLTKPGPRGVSYLPYSPESLRMISVPPLGLSYATVEPIPEIVQIAGAGEVIPFVCLPLALYVRSTTHLYEMLDRLQNAGQQLRARGVDDAATSASGSRCNSAGVDQLRAILDCDERRYSYLVFAVVGALQSLHLAKQRLGYSFPWQLLASSPPDPARKLRNGYPMQYAQDFKATQFIYRGLWIGEKLDEERARFQYSFQSFSREVAGMNKVLSFYASIDGSRPTRLAAEHNHILVFVARVRFNDEACLAMPVQLFEGPSEKGSEMEVLFPPYVRYKLEEDLSISSADFDADGPKPNAAAKLRYLSNRWKGFELPEMLQTMLQRGAVPEEFEELRTLRPFVTVRFIRSISLPKPLQAIFKDPSLHLYDFPARSDIKAKPLRAFREAAAGSAMSLIRSRSSPQLVA